MNFLSNLFGSEISKEQLSSRIKEGAFLVDVRSPGEFNSGSVMGAVNIPLDDITRQRKMFEDKKSIIVFCRSGNRSMQAKKILEQLGFKQVLNGGTVEKVNLASSFKGE